MSSPDLCADDLAAPTRNLPGIVVDKDKRTVTIDAKIAPRKIDDPRYKEIYPIEVIACWPFPKGQKAHETVVTIEAKPSEVHKALDDLGLKPGKPGHGRKQEAAARAGSQDFPGIPGRRRRSSSACRSKRR